MNLRRRSRAAVGAAAVAMVALPIAGAAGGDLDASFGDGGKVVTPLGRSAIATSVAVQPDGRIVVAGVGDTPLLLRYQPDGTLDAAFGAGGRAATVGGRLALLPDGRIVVAGTTADGDFVLARHRADGSLDPTFGDAGTVTTDLGGAESLLSMFVQRDGRIVAVGYSLPSAGDGFSTARVAVARFQADGRLDPTFATGGRFVDLAGARTRAGALAPGGKVVVVAARIPSQGTFAQLVVARLTTHGRLDTSFSRDGIATVDPTRVGAPFPSAVAVQPDGRIVVAAAFTRGNVYGLLRFRANGSLDPTFGYGVSASVPNPPVYGLRALAIDTRGRIVGVGNGPDILQDFAVMRVTPGGQLDRRFGAAGAVNTDFGGNDDAFAVAMQPDGKIVAVGWTGPRIFEDARIALARYLPTTCVVANVRGRTLAVARRAIERGGCNVARVTRAFSSRVPRGRVISQRPRPGTEVAEGSRVAVVVSRGRGR